MVDLILLASLLNGPAYGYALKKTAGMIFGSGHLHNNVVYPTLNRFVQSGWVGQSTVEGERGQQRKQYRLTPAGRKHMIEQLGIFGEREAADDGAFLLRLALFDMLSAKNREDIIEKRKSFLTARAAELARLREMTPGGSFPEMALERVQNLVKDELRWLRQVNNALERKTKH